MKIRVDSVRDKAWWGDRPVRGLTPTEVRVLSYLMAANGSPLTRARLYRLAWGHAPNVAVALAKSSRSINIIIYRIRQKLGAVSPVARVALASVKGYGYRLKA